MKYLIVMDFGGVFFAGWKDGKRELFATTEDRSKAIELDHQQASEIEEKLNRIFPICFMVSVNDDFDFGDQVTYIGDDSSNPQCGFVKQVSTFNGFVWVVFDWADDPEGFYRYHATACHSTNLIKGWLVESTITVRTKGYRFDWAIFHNMDRSQGDIESAFINWRMRQAKSKEYNVQDFIEYLQKKVPECFFKSRI